MKIESVKPAKNLPETVMPMQNMPALKKGDTLKAEVLLLGRENITLKSAEGKVFGAKIVSDLLLSEGDRVELFVQGKSVNELVFKVVSVESGRQKVPAPLDSLVKSLTEQYGEKAANALNALQKLDIKPTAERLQSIFNIVKQNPSLTVKAAVFLSVNGFPATPENVSAVQAFLSGDAAIGARLTSLLHDIAGEGVLLHNAAEEPAHPGVKPDGTPSYASAAGIQTTGALDAPAKESFKTIRPEISSAAKTPEESGGQKASPATEVGAQAQPGTKSALAGEIARHLPDTAGQADSKQELSGVTRNTTDIKGEPQEAAQKSQPAPEGVKTDEARKTAYNPQSPTDAALPETPGANTAQERAVMEIARKILSAFVAVKDADDINNIKKAPRDTLKNIAKLKELLQNTDIKGKESFAAKLDETIAQQKFTAEIDRFFYMQLPLALNGALNTAEVYVYKRKKRGKQVDADNTVLIIALDTLNIGRVEVQLMIENRNVMLAFKLNHDAAMQAIRYRAISLHKGFRELGYNLADTLVAALTKKTTLAEAEEELIHAAVKKPVLMDYRV